MRRSSSFLLPHLDSIPDTYSVSVVTSAPCLLYLLNKNKIFPLHRSALRKSIFYETKFADKENKFLIIDQKIENQAVEKVLKSLYGESLTFYRNWEILSVYKLLDLLGMTKMKESIVEDTLINYSEYSFFVLFNLCVHFSVPSLFEKCLDELILYGFQQLEYNKYDLFQCDIESLKKIIQIYSQSSLQCEGQFVSKTSVIKIVKWYCRQNQVCQQAQKQLISLVGQGSSPHKMMSINQSEYSEENKKESILKSTMSSWNRKSVDSTKGLIVIHGSQKPQTFVCSQLDEQSCEEDRQNDPHLNISKKSLTSSQRVEPEKKQKGEKLKGKRFSCMAPSSSLSYLGCNVKVNVPQ